MTKEKFMKKMQLVFDIIELGYKARKKAGIPIKQPLAILEIQITPEIKEILDVDSKF